MPLHFPARPIQVAEIAASRLQELARTNGFLTPGLRETGGQDIVLSTPHRVYFLGLNTLADDPNPLSSARDLGWRFFVTSADRVVAAIDVRRIDDDGHRPGPLTEGPFVHGTAKAFREAEVQFKHDPTEYEPILLVAPAIHVSALLLRTAVPEMNRILAVPPIARPFRPYHPVTVASFEADVSIVAKQVCEKTASLLAAAKPCRRDGTL